MPKTVQITDIDDDTYRVLEMRAADNGCSVPEYLRNETTKLANHLTMKEWLDRVEGRHSSITRSDIMDTLNEMRGPWPDDCN